MINIIYDVTKYVPNTYRLQKGKVEVGKFFPRGNEVMVLKV